MTLSSPRQPGIPLTPQPPARLLQILKGLADPAITRTGLTTESDGRWALMVRLREGTPTPLDAVERASGGFPIVYEIEPATLPVARPAFPKPDPLTRT